MSFNRREPSISNDCLPGSLNSFNLSDLLEIMAYNLSCFNEAQKVFKSNYEMCNFELSNFNIYDHNMVESDNLNVYIKGFGVIRTLLLHFGDQIQKLQINFSGSDEYLGKEILKYVNDHCNESLKKLDLFYCKRHQLDELKNTFQNVVWLKFSPNSQVFQLTIPYDRHLNKYFPNVMHLFVDQLRPTEWPFIDGSFPNLLLFGVELSKRNDRNAIDESHVASFLRKNTQITALRIKHVNLRMLKVASEILPQLDALEILLLAEDYLNVDDAAIHFNKVNYLFIESPDGRLPENIHFDQIVELTVKVRPTITEKWFEFIKNNINNFNTFRIYLNRLPDERVLNIRDETFQSKEIYIFSSSMSSAQHVMNFIGDYYRKGGKYLNIHIRMDKTEKIILQQIVKKNRNIKIESDSDEMANVIVER